MFDDSEQELGPVLALVLAVAVLTSLFAIAVALAVTGMFAPTAARASRAPVTAATSAAGSADRGAEVTALAPARIDFALDSAQLPADAGSALFMMAVAATVEPDRHLEVSGYHDTSGDRAHAVELAKARAIAVRDALTAAGVPAGRIDLRQVEVPGGADPRDARRVEITLH